MDLGLQDKVALITGASKGLGKGIAEELAREGAKVSICARGREELEKAKEEIQKNGVEVLAVQADVTKTDAVQRVVDETIEAFAGINILVNNAGAVWLGRGLDTSEEEWKYTLDVNLFSAVRFTRGVVPSMRQQGGGRIINISSAAGHTILSGFVDYNAAKAAMIAYSKTMSIDLAPDNILVNCVCPALIHTPLWDELIQPLIPAFGETLEEVRQNFANQYLEIKRFGRVEEVSGLVAFLASERASFITGSAYDVDGGFTKSMF